MLKCHCSSYQPIPAHKANHGAQEQIVVIQGMVSPQINLLKIFCVGGRVPEEIWPRKAF